MIKNWHFLTGHRAVEAGSHQAAQETQSRMKTEISITDTEIAAPAPDGRCSSMGPPVLARYRRQPDARRSAFGNS